MKFIVTCPGCSNRTNLEAQNAFGRRAKCKKCNLDFALEPANTREIPDLAAELLRKAEEDDASVDRTHRTAEPPSLPSLEPIEQSLSKELNLNRPPRVTQVFPRWMMTVQFAVGIVASVMITLASAVAILRNSLPTVEKSQFEQVAAPPKDTQPTDASPESAGETEKKPASLQVSSEKLIATFFLAGAKANYAFDSEGTKVYNFEKIDAFLMLKGKGGGCDQITVAMSKMEIIDSRQKLQFLYDASRLATELCDESVAEPAVQFLKENINESIRNRDKKFVSKGEQISIVLVTMLLNRSDYVFVTIVPTT